MFKNKQQRQKIGGAVPTLTESEIKKFKFHIPIDLDEVRKIGQFFSKFDSLIALYEQKVKLLTQIKKYFLDNLFAEKDYPNLRFKGFTDALEQRKLEKLFSERKERSTKGNLSSVTLTKGVIKTTDLDKKINSNIITGNYKVVKKNDYTS
ncbi:restriction endonuclease subunit S [Ligilactobacillus sp. LYQ135]